MAAVVLACGILTCGLFTCGLLTVAGWRRAHAADPPSPAQIPAELDFSAELPRIAPTEPNAAVDAFKTAPGFKMELVACEPQVHDPVAIAFDEFERIYVVEMCDYSEQDKERLGVIRRLEDRDRDGRYETSTAFETGLSWPTAITCWNGGVFVAAAPELWYLKDTNGDGVADQRRLVYTGFQRGNVQGLVNSLHWGPDHRIHGSSSTSGAELVRPDDPNAAPVWIGGRNFAFDPQTLKVEPTSGTAQHGMCFDDFGRQFVCSNSDHIQQVLFDDDIAARNPSVTAPNPRVSISEDGAQAEVFRISPVEPWRIVRTRLRVGGVVPGLTEGGGRASGYFTSATGVTVYRGDAWPAEFRGLAFVGDVGSNIIHRKRLESNGVPLLARRIDEGFEFVASTDIWFRPVAYANGPDGNLHVCDMYREVIEHPASLPPVIKKHLDLTSGRDRGRIWRVVHEAGPSARKKLLGGMNTAELVAAIDDANGWRRDTACRLLTERRDPSAIEPLKSLVHSTASSAVRVQAMSLLLRLDPQGNADDAILDCLRDSNPDAVEATLRLARGAVAKSERLSRAAAEVAAAGPPAVRFQLALTAADFEPELRTRVLGELLERDGGDPWIRFAALSSSAEGGETLLHRLAASSKLARSEFAGDVLGDVSRMLLLRRQPGGVKAVVDMLNSLLDNRSEADPIVHRVMLRVHSAVQRAGPAAWPDPATSSAHASIKGRVVENSRSIAEAPNAPEVERVAAVERLQLSNFVSTRRVLLPLIEQEEFPKLREAAFRTLGTFDDPEIGELLVARYERLPSPARPEVIALASSRSLWAVPLLNAVASGRVPFEALDASLVQQWVAGADKPLAELATGLVAKHAPPPRATVIAEYESCLKMQGDAERGKAIFARICSECHKVGGVGNEIGPQLKAFRSRGAESILINVLDPNREVQPAYVAFVIHTKAGKSYSGLIISDTATSITLQKPGGETETLSRDEIESMSSTRQSLMPEGLERQISPEQMADLLAFLMSTD
jgi:putative membrane-bound dehydrogenase-like protein